MYTKLVLAVLVFWGGLLQAQVIDSLPVKDSIYAKTDTVYIEQPPLIIKRQVVVHDTVAELVSTVPVSSKSKLLKELSNAPWYVGTEGGLDPWMGQEQSIDSVYYGVNHAYSYSASIGKEMRSIYLSLGVAMQQFTLNEEIQQILTRYDTTIVSKTYPLKYPNGQRVCIQIEKEGKKTDSCLSYTIETVEYDTTYSTRRLVLSKNQINYLTIPLKLGKRFEFKSWYIAPELWIMPMFSLSSQAFSESKKLRFDKRLTAYKASINMGKRLSKRLSIEFATGYQATLGHASLDMKFINLHLGLKYYLSKGTD